MLLLVVDAAEECGTSAGLTGYLLCFEDVICSKYSMQGLAHKL